MTTPKGEDVIPGLGSRRGVPRVAATIDWKTLDLDDVHGFVLSRVDGRTTLAEICLLSPFPEAQTVEVLRSLHGRGAIDVPGVARQPAAPPPASSSAATIPGRPAAQANSAPVGSRPPSPLSSRGPGAASPSPRPAAPAANTRPPLSHSNAKPPAASAGLRPPPPIANMALAATMPNIRVPLTPDAPVPPARELITPPPAVPEPAAAAPASVAAPAGDTIDLAPDLRLRVDAMLVLIDNTAEPRAILGVAAGTDAKELKRVYFRLSKEYHPDRYFNRQLGPYKRHLQTIFNALKAAYDVLNDEARGRSGP